MKTLTKTLIATTIAMLSTSTYANNHIAQVDDQGHIKKYFALTQEAGQVTSNKSTLATKSIHDETYSGQEAIDFLGNDFDKVAEKQHYDPSTLKQVFLSDSTLRVDKEGKLLFVEHAASASFNKPQASTEVYTGDPLKLHSKRGAKKVIYLNTTGFDPTNTGWSDATHNQYMPGWGASKSDVYNLWAKVAEDYAPFDVDVTTEQPSDEAIARADESDEYYGTTAVITSMDSTIVCGKGGCGGVAYLGSFNWMNVPKPTPVLVFSNWSGVAGVYVAEATSHEIGHSFLLLHDGTSTAAYFGGDENWAPIMGASYCARQSHFSKGEYPDANNHEDDLAIINQMIPFNSSDVPDTLELAYGLETDQQVYNSSTIKTVDSTIENSSDKDVYSFNTVGGPVKFDILPKILSSTIDSLFNKYANLKPKVTIVNEANEVLVTGEYTGKLKYEALISTTLPAGKYYLVVESSEDTGVFAKYGSIGQYSINGSFTSSDFYKPPVAVIESSATEGVGPLTINLSAAKSQIGENSGSTLKYRWTFENGTATHDQQTSVTYNTTGHFTITLTVTNEAGLVDVKTVDVNVTAPLINVAKVKSLSIKLTYYKKYDMTSARVTAKVVTEKNKGVKQARVCGYFTGSFNDTVSKYSTTSCAISNNSGIANIDYPTWMLGKKGTLIFNMRTIDGVYGMVFDKIGSPQSSASITK